MTEIEKHSELMFRKFILETYPEHSFLEEEDFFTSEQSLSQVLQKARDIPFLWIFDPIDGTTDFIHSISGFTVLI